jgi:hypothetical protein
MTSKRALAFLRPGGRNRPRSKSTLRVGLGCEAACSRSLWAFEQDRHVTALSHLDHDGRLHDLELALQSLLDLLLVEAPSAQEALGKATCSLTSRGDWRGATWSMRPLGTTAIARSARRTSTPSGVAAHCGVAPRPDRRGVAWGVAEPQTAGSGENTHQADDPGRERQRGRDGEAKLQRGIQSRQAEEQRHHERPQGLT